MTASAHSAGHAERLPRKPILLPLWGWLAIALALIATRFWFTTGRGLADFLGDMDDAARLVQVREFMAGAPWFDTHTQALGGTNGMLSHWSRLIDLPLALLIALAALVTDRTHAELFARSVWPLLVLAPLLWAVFKTAAHAAGAQAGRIALALAILCPLGLYQFDVGRIDHHNAMIASTVAAALMMWAYPHALKAWAIAGVLTGFALIIGFEALAPAAALAVAAALWGLLDKSQARVVQGFMLALMAALALGFLISIPPARWMDIRCDAISFNIVALSAIAGTALVAALSPHAGLTLPKRFALAALGAAVGLTVYGALEPKCLAGPMGQLPAELKPVWLNYVAETRSILRDLFSGKIEQSLGLTICFAIGIAAQAHRTHATRQPNDAFLLACVTAFAIFAFWQYKYIAYASFIAIVPLACWIATLRGSTEISPMATQAMAVVLLSQASLLGASGLLQKAMAAPVVLSDAVVVGAEACERNSAVRDLADLQPGLIAARIDLGAYLVAVTPHRALSAPYHRIADAIITNHHIFAARNAADAARLLRQEKIDYVVTCKGLDDPFVSEPEWRGTLRADLVAGHAPAFLKPVTLSNPRSLFRVWRVEKDALNLPPSGAATSVR